MEKNIDHPETQQLSHNTLQYANQTGKLTFNIIDAEKSNNMFCCERITGVPYYPFFLSDYKEYQRGRNTQNSIKISKKNLDSSLDNTTRSSLQQNDIIKNIGILCNPNGGAGQSKQIALKFASYVEKNTNIKVDLYYSESDNHLQELAQNFDFKKYNIMGVCGGDGTWNIVLNQLAIRQKQEKSNQSYTICVLPGGTGNDFFKSIGGDWSETVNKQIKKITQNILDDKIKRMDIGHIQSLNEHGQIIDLYFHCSVGLGFAADTVIRAQNLGLFKSYKYKVSAFFELITGLGIDCGLNIDNEQIFSNKTNSKVLQINNTQYIGGGMRFCPYAIVDDGLLDVLVGQTDSKLTMINFAKKICDGQHIYMNESSYYRGKEVKVTFDTPQHIQLDGEIHKIYQYLKVDLVQDLINIVALF